MEKAKQQLLLQKGTLSSSEYALQEADIAEKQFKIKRRMLGIANYITTYTIFGNQLLYIPKAISDLSASYTRKVSFRRRLWIAVLLFSLALAMLGRT